MGVKVFDPDQVVIMFANAPIKGFADGTFIKLSPTNDAFTTVQGADGEVARSRQNNRLHDIEITLLQTSQSNAILSAIHKADQIAPNGAGIAMFVVKDLSGQYLFKSAESWIVKGPDVEMARTAGPRVWKLQAVEADEFHGGA